MTTTEEKPRGQITTKERNHLRALIRQHYVLLRKEVSTEEARALAEVDTKIAEYHQRNAKQAAAFHTAVAALVAKSNVKLAEIKAQHAELFADGGRWTFNSMFHSMRAYRTTDDEHTLRRALVGQIKAKAYEARTRIEREQNERLREILVDALESTKALEIEGSLPDLAEVFTVNLQAIEAGAETPPDRTP